MVVFAVFEICYGSYGDYYQLISICSTQEKAEDIIKNASLKSLESYLKMYLEYLNRLSDETFFEGYKALKDLYAENSKQLKKFFKDHFWLSYHIDETPGFDIDKRNYIQGPFELSKEQRDQITPVLQNEVFQKRFERIQQKELEEKKDSDLRHSKFLELCTYGIFCSFGWGCRSIDYDGEVKLQEEWTEEDRQRVNQLLEEDKQRMIYNKENNICDDTDKNDSDDF